MAVRFQYEWHDTSGQWWRSYGNELWEFTPEGLMSRREASINDHADFYLVTTMTTRDSGEERLAAYAALATQDPVLAAMTQTHGTPDPFVWNDGGRTGSSNFAAMVLHIIGQQISTTVALILYDRVAAATGDVPDADSVIALGPDRLRSQGQFDIQHRDDLSDEEAVAALTAVTGVGLWSAEMFLIHQLRRRDVLPAGDIGVRRAIARAWTLDQAPTIDEVRQRGQTWAPYRSYATALLWRSLKEGAPT